MDRQGSTILVAGTPLLASAFLQSLRFGLWNVRMIPSWEEALGQPVPDATVLLCPSWSELDQTIILHLSEKGHRCLLVLFFSPSERQQQQLQSMSGIVGYVASALAGIELALVLSQVCEGQRVVAGQLPAQVDAIQTPYRIVFSPSTLYRIIAALRWEHTLQPADLAILAHYFDPATHTRKPSAALRHNFSVRIYDFLTEVKAMLNSDGAAPQRPGAGDRVNSRLSAGLVLLEAGVFRQIPAFQRADSRRRDP